MATRPGQRTLEAARGNGYAPVRGTYVMMMMISSETLEIRPALLEGVCCPSWAF